ncbi:hypothetical protein MHBO_000229 [Bonamia ostreae]|uniref:Uncharacterized protein n=1 Tax=Bonamia ostreae TaxID=126728 RepID=A0ABV2AEW7_9EUKA
MVSDFYEFDFLDLLDNDLEEYSEDWIETECEIINSLSEHELIWLFSALPLKEMWLFSHLCKKTLKCQSRFLKRVEKVDIAMRGPHVGKMLDLILNGCPNIESLRVYKYFYAEREHFPKISGILANCSNLKSFVGWLTEGVLSRCTKKKLSLRKVFIDMSETGNLKTHLEKFEELEELVLRSRDSRGVSHANMENIGDLFKTAPSLTKLSIRSIYMTDEVKKKLTMNKNLTHFEIIGGGYCDEDVDYLSRRLPYLTHIGLCGNELTKKGVKSIRDNIKRLHSLDIMVASCDSCEETFRFLCEKENFSELRFLYVRKWPVSWTEQFLRSKPLCKVVDFDMWRISFEN